MTFAGLPYGPNDANKPNDAHVVADGVKPVAEPPAWQDDPPDDALLLSLDLDALNGSVSVRGIPQNMRLHHIRKKCAELESPTNRTYRSSKRLLLDANRNLMYCMIPKVAGTLWSALLADANLDYKPMTNSNHMAIHTHRLNWANIELGYRYAKEYEKYTKFIVVRHPLDRLLSAYYNIVDRRSNLGPDRYAEQAILKMFATTKDKLTFSQFAEFLTSTDSYTYGRHLYDRHWDTYDNLCSVCSIAYDYVIYFEEMVEDAKPILKILGWPEDHLEYAKKYNPRANVGTKIDTYVTRLREYSELEPALMEKVLQRYGKDMTLFGYTFNSTSFTTGLDMNSFVNV